MHVGIAGRGDEDVGARRRLLHRHDLIALHRRLQRADRVDLGDEDAGAAVAQAGGRALADVAEAGDAGDLAGEHHVGGAADRVDQALLAAVEIVELRLGDAVVDVDRREGKLALLGEVVEPVDAGRGLLGDALDGLDGLGEVARPLGEEALQRRRENLLFLVGRREQRPRPPRPARPRARTWSRRRRRRGSCCRSASCPQSKMRTT